MAGRDGTYISKVGGEQGAGAFFIDSDGYLYVDSAGLTGTELKNKLYTESQRTIIANSAGVVSTINLPITGYIVFSLADAASNASAWLTSGPVAGQKMILTMRGVGSTGSVYISTSGVTIIGTISGEVSSVSLQNSANSMGVLTLQCFTDGEWSIVEKFGGVVERGLA